MLTRWVTLSWKLFLTSRNNRIHNSLYFPWGTWSYQRMQCNKKKNVARSQMGVSGVTRAGTIALTATSWSGISDSVSACLGGKRLVLLTIKQSDRPHLYSQVSWQGINRRPLRASWGRVCTSNSWCYHHPHSHDHHHQEQQWLAGRRWSACWTMSECSLRLDQTQVFPLFTLLSCVLSWGWINQVAKKKKNCCEHC